MDKYTIDEMKYKNGVRDGFHKGLRVADDRNQPKSPYNDDRRTQDRGCRGSSAM